MKYSLLFSLFFFSPSVCMIFHPKHHLFLSARIRESSKKYQEWIKQERKKSSDLFELMPSEITQIIMNNIDYKSNMRFIMSYKYFYMRYAEINKKNRNDICKYITNISIIDKDVDDCDKRQLIFGCLDYATVKKTVMQYNTSNYQASRYNKPQLHEAVWDNNIDYIKFLFQLDSVLVDRNVKFKGSTVLHIASNHEVSDPREYRAPATKMLKLLLTDPYVNRNTQNKYGCTALHLAVQEDKVEFLKLLLSDPYVDCNIKDNEGRTAYDYAIYHETNEKIKKLLSKRTSFFNKHKKNIENTVYAICGIGIVLLLWQSKIWSNLNSTFF